MTMDRSFRICIILVLGVAVPFIFILIPLYIRHHVFASYHLPVSSTDSRLLDYQLSTIWCDSETIFMNTTFNAYLLSDKPEFEVSIKTYWTTKLFQLGSEEREYWGFYLPKNTVITLSACARYSGAKLAVYQGKRNMKKCSNREDDDDQSVEENQTEHEFDANSDDEESSISSSEEDFLKECHGALFNHSLVPIRHCANTSNWQPKDIISYNVTSSDYYYFLFSSMNNLHKNTIISNFTLRKAIYNVTRAIDSCKNHTYCSLSLAFGSSETVVLEMPDVREWVVDAGEIICEPRTVIYFPFYLGVPLSILFFAFRGIR